MRKILLAVALPAVALTVQSCLNDDDSYYDSLALMQPNAIVTVKPLDGGGFYMQLDDNTTLKP
ncbi:MAG: NigD-like N-terminal domain-containing protein, partial [Bacteroidetes bacterium]|nr:NigD-like N-terminal domain-containing protein [Candidatus Cryptobacteroides merdavium]